MTHFADRPYLELSGGERQLVMIARALAQSGQYFIMDEPVTGLDYGNHPVTWSSVTGDHTPAFILTTHHPGSDMFSLRAFPDSPEKTFFF